MTHRRALTIIILLTLIGLLSALAGVLVGLLKLPTPITTQPLVALVLVGAALGGLGYWLFRIQTPTETLPLRRRHCQRMLARVRTRVIKQLADSLQGATLLALGLHEQPNAVISLSALSLQHPNQPTQPLPPQTHILQAYEEAEGQLLLLGEPGAGKTTLLLELAHDLLERAQQDANIPIPVIFNLASWAVKRQPLGDWMVEELAQTYQVPRKLGQSWIVTDEIQPLLDGLDEVTEAQRSACVEAINAYQKAHGLLPTVVCSRKSDYFSQPRRLLAQNAVVVQPLSQQQIDALLSRAGEQLAGLRQALATEPTLQELAALPLMLNLMMLAYQEMPGEQIIQQSPLSTRQQQVLGDYVQRRLQRRGTGARYTPEHTLRWLGWLARQMTERNQAAFTLKQLQPDWLPTQRLQSLYYMLNGLVVGIIVCLAGVLIGPPPGDPHVSLVSGLFTWLVVGLVGGYFCGLLFERLPKVILKYLRNVVRRMDRMDEVGMAGILDGGLVNSLLEGLVVIMVFGGLLAAVLVRSIFDVRFRRDIMSDSEGNEKYGQESFRWAIKYAWVGLVVFLAIGLVGGLGEGLGLGLIFGLRVGFTTVALLLGEVEAREKNILKYLKQRQIRLELCRNLL